jgi:hypothetical protein
MPKYVNVGKRGFLALVKRPVPSRFRLTIRKNALGISIAHHLFGVMWIRSGGTGIRIRSGMVNDA